MIVEDEELERRALRKILEEKHDGVRVVGEARNGAEAVRLIETTHIDLMLVDIRIPRPNGLEIIQIIRDRGLPTRVIILTAYDHFDIMKEAIHLKADNFLLKPIRTAELLSAVTACIGDAAPRQEQEARKATDEFARLADENRYRDCLSMARSHLQDIFGTEGAPLHRAVRDLFDALTDSLQSRGLEVTPELAGSIRHLLDQNLDIQSHFQVQELAFQVVDQLFQVKGQGGARTSDHVQDVLNFIERNLHKRVTLEGAANFAHISPCYLSRLFRKEMDATFVSYIREQRITRAKELLGGSDLPIGNVALDLSFSDANYFCKAFKKEVGLSPTEYRRKLKDPKARLAN
ncbi:response regulator [Aliiruegeria haliotis]|uniref:response regulator n=1 Tax=Aliiruegeria haliotis TaxID=1280846 RepID=UPI001FE58D98|nr:response regulator [Aliiruegeria haliotis]